VAPELRGVHGDEPRAVEPAGELLGGGGHQPVVGVHEVEAQAVGQLAPGRAHVGVHGVDPADEGAQVVLRVLGLAQAMHDHAVAVLLGRQAPPAAREDVDLDALAHELLGQLAHVTGEAALDDGRVLPREDQHARAHAAREATARRGRAWRWLAGQPAGRRGHE
jgi:hypothetical protein